MSSGNVIQGGEAPRSLPPPIPGPPRKNPLVALVLSTLFPGIGQVYNGQPAKAVVFFLGFVASIVAIIEIEPLPYALVVPFVYFYGLVDAYRSADLLNLGPQSIEDDSIESPVWGGILVLLGAIILASNLGWLNLASMHRFWPIILIVFGILFIRRSLVAGKGTSASP